MFAITRRPSATTSGRWANLPSSRTSWATARVAAAPFPIATPMSASLSASASLTPSPVIATTWPRLCSAVTMARFCCGDTRPNTLRWSTISAIPAGSSGRSRASKASVARVTPGTWTAQATAPTVRGLSPEITLRATPCSVKKFRVAVASSRIRSARITSAAGDSVVDSVVGRVAGTAGLPPLLLPLPSSLPSS
jgi:hypothetical protein